MNSIMSRRMPRWAALLGATAVLAAFVTGCASSPGGPPPAGPLPDGYGIAAIGEVVGQGTVLQVGDAPPQFCLGAVMESYPPQCSGPELIGWDWDGMEGSETSGDVTWGTYAVWGTWDGERFTATDAVMLALYDPMAEFDPHTDPANAGDTAESDLASIQQELHGDAPFEVLASWPENGYLFVHVIYDNGDLQRWVDETYGPEVVVITSALRPVA